MLAYMLLKDKIAISKCKHWTKILGEFDPQSIYANTDEAQIGRFPCNSNLYAVVGEVIKQHQGISDNRD